LLKGTTVVIGGIRTHNWSFRSQTLPTASHSPYWFIHKGGGAF